MLVRSLIALLVVAFASARAAGADDAPKLAVYPFTASGSAGATVGAAFADAVAADVRSDGSVTVVRGAAGLAPAQFRADAREQGAEFFLIGAIAPVGTSYSVIEQLVRTRTGLLVWSDTAQAASPADLKGHGAQVRQVLLDQLGHAAFPKLAAAPPSAPPPAIRDKALASAPVSRPAVAPPSTFVVLSFGGSALPSDRAFAVRAVLENIRRRGVTAAAQAAVPADLQTAGAQACADTNAATVVAGTLDTTRVSSLTAPGSTTASLALQVYDCRSHQVAAKPLTATKTMSIGTDAIRGAADDAAATYFGSAPPSPHF